jgi:TonB family protein
MFTITGPLKDRKVLSQVVPEYPEWARSQGVEDLVVLQFTVTPEGRVKENIQSLRASAYPELDALAKEALLQWVFVPLPDGQWRDEVGTITMSFSVR